MQIFLIKNNFNHLFKICNKSLRFSFQNRNFCYYKFNKNLSKTFCNKNVIFINKEKDLIGDLELDLDNIKEIKEISLNNNYLTNKENDFLKSSDNNSQLPVKTNKIEDEEIEIFMPNKNLSKGENFRLYKEFINRKEIYEREYNIHRTKIGLAIFIFFLCGFSLWIPLYKSICESQGFSVKTGHQDYNFDGRKLNVMKKFTIKFINEVDVELPWTFEPLQKEVTINAGETCLIFYRAKNLTDEPIVGLSVYDVHPQSTALYFNKIQCFCFENQMLGPREEVDLPVFFYIDPAINDDLSLDDYREFILKYTFYFAKKQDLAKVMSEHLEKEREDREKLNEKKRELNKQGKNYKIEEFSDNSGLPGINPALGQFYINRTNEGDVDVANSTNLKN